MLPGRERDVGEDRTTIQLPGTLEASPLAQKVKMQNFRRRAGCCVRAAPWVSALCCIMTAVGLAVWYIFAKRALALTQGLASQVFSTPLKIVQELTNVVGWVTLLMVIIVSCLLGITMFVSLMRTYQRSAQLPTTNCGSPGKLSYGSYAAFAAILNFAWWLLTIVVALLIAANLVWLTIAFLFNNAFTLAVTDTPTQAAAGGCPSNCLNLGSFYTALQLEGGCACSGTSVANLRSATNSLWQDLIHVLAALALMGLGCLWQLMNLSANFAHARRDLHGVTGHVRANQYLTGDAVATVLTSPTYIPSSSKKATPRSFLRDQDAGHTTDTSGFPTSTPADYDNAAPLTEPATDPTADHMTYNSAYESYHDPATAGTEPLVPAAGNGHQASSPSSRSVHQ
eukprot:GHRR01018327.1.p1 GENE.GHRR01018327.1~~GHRR01018327.1.p1  ORF type:complete len:397 (+),score=97.48 GHRR01018327.1:325-1515(+)